MCSFETPFALFTPITSLELVPDFCLLLPLAVLYNIEKSFSLDLGVKTKACLESLHNYYIIGVDLSGGAECP